MGNASGKAASRNRNKKSVHWKAAERPPPPGKPQLVPGTPNTEPDVVNLRWERPVGDGGSPVIGYLVEHKRTGSPHWVRATPGLVGKPELSLSGLEPGWRYQFRVTAHNAAGISDPSELSEPLTVTFQRTVITAPRFTEELQDTTALENEKVEFVVHLSGIPIPNVCWYKDGFEIFSSRRTRILSENGQSLLIIHQTALVDEGEIKCTATNKAGHITTKAFLKIEAPARVRLPRQYEDGLLFEMDEAIRLKVSVAGKPPPEVFWSHNGESLANDSRYEVVNSDRTSTLKVGAAKRTDRGEYQVRAVNKLGEHVGSFLVTVTDRPLAPSRIRVISLGKSVTISWSAPADDGGCKIGSYIIEYYRVGWNVWLKAGTSRKLSSTLGELIEGSEYRFRVKAENPYGISDPSDESETIFIPDPKRGLLEPPPRIKSQSPEAIPNVDDVRPPIIQRRRKNMDTTSETSSLSSMDSRPTSPTPISTSPPRKPVRGQNVKTPAITPDPSPITRRRETQPSSAIARNMFDRSSVTRELSYGISNIMVKKDPVITLDINRTQSPTERTRRFSRSRSPSPSPPPKGPITFNASNPMVKTNNTNNLESPRNDDILHGSSEFMLVLLPDHNNSAKNKNSRSESNVAAEFDEISVAPPMSLSAPELGFEPPFLGSLRNAVSSSEIMHERAMTRFYEAAAADEAEREKRRASVDNRRSPDPLPRIRINSIETDESIALERKHSLRRRLSGSGLSQQLLWQQRLSWKSHEDDGSDRSPSPKGSPKTLEKPMDSKPLQDNHKIKTMITRQRSESEEMEEEVFEQVRNKMAKQNSLEEKQKISVAPEDKWEEEVVDEDLDEYDIDESISTEESDDDRPWSEEIIPDRPIEEDEPMYHPRMMISRTETPIPTNAPFEILTKPNPLPDPNFIPKPILKKPELRGKNRNEEDKTTAPNKPIRKNVPIKETQKGFLKNIAGSINQLRNKAGSPIDAKLEQDYSVEKLEKPKVSIEQKPVLEKITYVQNLTVETKPAAPKSPILIRRSSQHTEQVQPQSSQKLIIISAAEAARKKRLEVRQSSIEETKVAIDHYMDIVREYGGPKKQPITLHLSTEALKAAAASSENLDSDEEEEEPPPPKPQNAKISYTSFSNSSTPYSQIAKPPPPALISQTRSEIDRPISRSSKYDSSNESLSSKNNESRLRRLRGREPQRVFERESSVSRPLRAGTNKQSARPESVSRNTAPEQRALTPEQEGLLADAEIKVRSTVDYMTDVAMFLVACWVYLFKDERLAIPILILMVYRQLSEEISQRIPNFLRRTKKS